ncbi:hypothetical protein D3C85_1474670 [compost metagenome]
MQVLLARYVSLDCHHVGALLAPVRRDFLDFFSLDVADDQLGLLGRERRNDGLTDALSGTGQQHHFVFQALALGRFGHRRQGKRFSHESPFLFAGTTKTGHLPMSGQKTVWKIAASLHLFCFFKCECV